MKVYLSVTEFRYCVASYGDFKVSDSPLFLNTLKMAGNCNEKQTRLFNKLEQTVEDSLGFLVISAK